MTSVAPLIEEFRRRATTAESVVHEVSSWDEVVSLVHELAGADTIAVTPTLARARPELMAGLGDRARIPDADAPFESVADVAVGVSEGQLAVAESGSVLLTHDDAADRAVSMLSHTAVQVVPRERVVAGLDEAASWLEAAEGPLSLATLSTGPSRTADIERSLTIGVQGPSQLHVVILG